MGKRAELMDQLDELDWDDPRVPDIQKEINRIEQWCIDNKPEWDVKITVWGKINSNSELYPWHSGVIHLDDIFMVGDFNESGKHLEHDGSPHICSQCS